MSLPLPEEWRTAKRVAPCRFAHFRPDAACSLRREAIEQAVAAGGDQVGLATAARHVRRVPRLREFGRLRVRSMWPSMAEPKVLLVQLLQVRLRLAGQARPS